jgi:hypothetical protein
MEMDFSSESPDQKNFLKKAGKGIGKAAGKVLPVAQRILPVAAVIVPALRPVAAIVDAIPSRK